MTDSTSTARRRQELADALDRVRGRIEAACRAADRDPAGVRLLAVTKTFPAGDAALLADLGVTDLAEARDQEAAGKVAELAGLRPGRPVRWHMVGRLQRNKARSVARWAVEVQSVDSHRLADALAAAVGKAIDAGTRTDPMRVLVQASLDADPARGGCPVDELAGLADHVAGLPGLRLAGVMGVAPLGADSDAAFARLAAAADHVRRRHPAARELSAGMSADLAEAIRHGSTCVRVGTALMGGRQLASP